ncbi:8-amino-7-oxononanoate synthase [Arthrobacter bambusae]|uniref:8-amino-7-oxononanoate synthase n=2 Tax=Arthrobacter bambusae TaxID=1338426 RepID=A0AAW8DIM5_9MICC|nr:8-amino-7-oxononanoate synthase [Arthrobacter bambusae]MDP9905931.1 8-amino-7-oxononanoate synthase [Arthrobacter bambusae]MDQ0130162.1 8-amino-7-oxononanoate synthase [Arthrobacter bambusae]MDQ0181542.1 8-amino-7-oxononanoate synthase [Arthrobacter bambusae]
MSRSMTAWLEQQAAVRERRGLVRSPLTRLGPDAAVDLASNDYLGLATDPRLAEAAREAIGRWGTGATSSRLVAGTTALHLELESELASLTGMESALVFSSGYLANLGITTALGGPGALIVADEHCHASLIDGFRLSRSRVETVPHNNLLATEHCLRTRTEPRALIAVESIYSVFGDAAPLPRLLALAEEHDAVLLVDEAHSLGVSGRGAFEGHGAVAGTDLSGHPNVVLTATLSKSLGSQGGAVLGSALLREHLVNRARSFIFDTGLAPSSAAAALAAVGIIRTEPWRAAAVHHNAASLSAGLATMQREPGIAVVPVGAPLQTAGAVLSVPMPSAAAALAASQAAHGAGVRVGCFRPPSVPDGVSRLRLTARATLTPRDIDYACATLRRILEEMP